MSDCEDNEPVFNNDPDEGQEEQLEEEEPQVKEEKPKPRRARAPAAYDANTDATCIAILEFLTTEPAPAISRTSTIEIDGKSVSVGTMMYTLRRRANKPDTSTPLVNQRLAHLASNARWLEFLSGGGSTRKRQQPTQHVEKQDDDNDNDQPSKLPAATTTAANNTAKRAKTEPPEGIEKDIRDLAYQCAQRAYRIGVYKEHHMQLMLTIFKCFPHLQPLLTRHMVDVAHKRVRL